MMVTPAFEPTVAPDPMPAELAARVTAFARACKAAVRTVALYPGEHPAVASALAAVTAAAEAATAQALLPLAVRPDGLTVDGRPVARPDAAVADLAAILHHHQVGQLTIRPLTDADTWRRFLALLSLPPDQARLRGGLGKLWASEGETRIEVRTLDYNELLRSRVRGEQATWDAIVAGCLEGSAFSLDDAMVELLFGILNDPEKIVAVMEAVESRLAGGGRDGQGPAVIAGLLQAVAQFVAASAPDEADSVMAALAEAATRLPVATLAPLVDGPRGGGFRPGLARFVQGLVRRVTDGSIANLIACEVRGGRGASSRLADAFCGLAPDPDRRSAILALARHAVEETGGTGDPELAKAWRESEDMLLTYSDKNFVSDAYNAELSRLNTRAVDLDRDHTDSAEVTAAWRESVDDSRLRLLDAGLIADLMTLQHDIAQWRELAALALHRVSVLLVVGDFPAAALLAEALRSQAENASEPEIHAAAAETLANILTASTMRHVASHLDTSDRDVVGAAQRFCAGARDGGDRPPGRGAVARGAQPAAPAPDRHPDRIRRRRPPVGRASAPVAQRRGPPDGRAAAARVRRRGSPARAGVAARRRRAPRAARGDAGHRHAGHRVRLRHAHPGARARHRTRPHVNPRRPVDAARRGRRAGADAPRAPGAVPQRDVERPRARD